MYTSPKKMVRVYKVLGVDEVTLSPLGSFPLFDAKCLSGLFGIS